MIKLKLWTWRALSVVLLLIVSMIVGSILDAVVEFVGRFFDPEFVFSGWKVAVWLFFITFGVAIADGLTTIDQGYIATRKVFGEYVCMHDPGLEIFIRFIETYDLAPVFEQEIELFVDDSGKQDTTVDFLDGAAPVKATLFVKIEDVENSILKALYGVEDVYHASKTRMRDAVRGFLQKYRIDAANLIKGRASLLEIMNGATIDPEEASTRPNRVIATNIEDLKAVMRDCGLWKFFYESYGILVTGIAIEDIEMPKNLLEARDSVIIADKKAEAAKSKKKETITLAEGEKQAAILQGEGAKKQIDDLVAAGIDPNVAMREMTDRIKWNKVGDKTVIIDSGAGSVAGLGAQFAAGQKTQNKEKE